MQLGRLLGVTLVLITGLCGVPTPGHSSLLVAPGSTPEDGALGSNVVALPLNAASALFHNPAHMTVLPASLTFGPGGLTLHPSYANEQGYDNTSREVPVGGNFGYITDRWAPLRVGIGMFGSVGFTFNFDADPEHGVPGKLFSEGAVVSVPLALAYPLTPQLHIGVALNPTYGRARFKSPSPVGRLDIDVRGPGVFGTVGVLYTPTANLSLGIGIKTPGTTWMFGNARVGGRGDDATLDFQLPTVVSVGAAYRPIEKLTVTAQARWTQFSVFEHSDLEFDTNTFLNRPTVPDAQDIWRFGVGVQYEVITGIKLLTGFSWEGAGVKASSMTPLFFDTDEYLIGAGITIERSRWQLTVGSGVSFNNTRRVGTKKNPFFPGRYSLDWTPFGVQLTRKFDMEI